MAEFKLPKNSQIVEGDTHPEPTSAGEKKVFKIYRGLPCFFYELFKQMTRKIKD